jgi:REP element-mobilizing transposase RayT
VDQGLRSVLGDERLRVVHLSVQSNHLHLIVETTGRQALAHAVQGLAIRLARGYNRAFGRHGRVFGDRYFARALKTPEAVRNALRYVLLNESHHHAERQRRRSVLADMLLGADGKWRRVPRGQSLPPSAYRPRGARLVGDDAEVRREATPIGSWLLEEGANSRAGPASHDPPGSHGYPDPESKVACTGAPGAEADQQWWSDPFSSAAMFDGWRVPPVVEAHAWGEAAAPIVPARTWLLRNGWRTSARRT